MRIAILGAKGMLGGALKKEFVDIGEVIALDREEIDIVDENMVRQTMFDLKPELVINAAAYTDVDGAENNRAAALAVNAEGVGNVARAVKDLGAVLIHYSTDYVFSGTKEEGYQEDDPPGPAVNSYGESKLAGERLLKEINPNFYLIRTAWLYGAGGKNFVDTMIKMGKKFLDEGEGQGEIRVVNDQWGSPTYTGDLAEATRKVVADKRPLGIYHLVNAGITNWHSLAVEIFSSLKWEVPITAVPSTEYPRPAKRPTWSVLCNEKGPHMRPWQNALADYLGAGMMSSDKLISRG